MSDVLPSSDMGERFLPDSFKGGIEEAEHLGRYALASLLALGKVVLDAGCGMGYGSAMLARAGAVDVVSFDVDETTVSQANHQFGNLANFKVDDVLALDLPPETFGLITCFEVIEHVADPERALDELARVLAPSGVLVLSTPNRGAYPASNPFHLKELTQEELTDALERRFEHVRILPQQFHLATLTADPDGHRAESVEVEVEAVVRKVEGTDPLTAPYTVALASNRPLPHLPGMAVLTGPLSLRLWLDACAAWEERARRAEAELSAAWVEIGYLRKMRQHMIEELERSGGGSGDEQPEA